MKKLGWILALCLILLGSVNYTSLSPQRALNVLSVMGRKAYISFTSSTGVNRVTKFGFNLDIDTGASETLGSLGDDPESRFKLAAETLSIVSTDAADTIAGTGAQLILLQCIGEDGTQSDVAVAMNGTTPVVTTAECKFLNRALAFQTGSGLRNAGDITITQSTSGVDLALIPAGSSVTQQLEYYVPSNRRCYMDDLDLRGRRIASGSTRMDISVKIYSAVTDTVYEIRNYLIASSSTSSGSIDRNDFKAEPLAPNEIIVFDITASSNNSAMTGSFDLTCQSEEL